MWHTGRRAASRAAEMLQRQPSAGVSGRCCEVHRGPVSAEELKWRLQEAFGLLRLQFSSTLSVFWSELLFLLAHVALEAGVQESCEEVPEEFFFCVQK